MSDAPSPRRLWITRTLPQAEATADRVRGAGWTPVVAPVLETRALSHLDEVALGPEGGGEADALAFTSQAAVRAYAALRRDRTLPVFVVGEATARAAFEAGFDQIDSPTPGEAGDVVALAERIAQAAPRPVLVLNPTAREPAANLTDLLARRGVAARSVAVYQTVETALTASPADLYGLLVHSPRAAWALRRLIAPPQAGALTAWTISEAAAAPLRPIGFRRLFVAGRPNETAMLDQLSAGIVAS